MGKKIMIEIEFPPKMREEAIREFASLTARYRKGEGIQKGMGLVLK